MDTELTHPDLARLRPFTLRIQIVAFTVASSLAVIAIPDLETITVMLFLVGYLFHRRFAISVCLLTTFTWELFASLFYGFSGIVFPLKLIAWLVVTILGGGARQLHITKPLEFAVLGAVSTLIYDLTVNLALPILFAQQTQLFLAVYFSYLLAGAYFTLWHVVTNVLLFASIPQIIQRLIPVLARQGPLLAIRITADGQLGFHSDRIRTIIIAVGLMVLLIISGIVVATLNQPAVNQLTVAPKTQYVVTLHINYSGVRPNDTFKMTFTIPRSIYNITTTQATVNFTLYGSSYGSAIFIDAINNVWNNANLTNHYWIIYQNNIAATAAANQVIVQRNTTLTWSYES